MDWKLALELQTRLPQIEQITIRSVTIWWQWDDIEIRFIKSYGKFEIFRNAGTFNTHLIAVYDTIDEVVALFQKQ